MIRYLYGISGKLEGSVLYFVLLREFEEFRVESNVSLVDIVSKVYLSRIIIKSIQIFRFEKAKNNKSYKGIDFFYSAFQNNITQFGLR